jgi:hypothetical protein
LKGNYVSEPGADAWAFPIWIMLKAKTLDQRILSEENRSLFLGYLVGFTEPVSDERSRAVLNKALLDSIYGDGLAVMDDIRQLAGRRDIEFIRGAGFGFPDGQRYWRVCDERFTCSSQQAQEVFIFLESMAQFLK